MKNVLKCLTGLLLFALAGCAGPVDEKNIFIAAERTKREVERTERERLKTQQFKMYYNNRGPEAKSLADIAAGDGPAAEVAAAEVSSAAPPGAVFRQPVPRSEKKSEPKEESLVKPDADPVCGPWAPAGLVLCSPSPE